MKCANCKCEIGSNQFQCRYCGYINNQESKVTYQIPHSSVNPRRGGPGGRSTSLDFQQTASQIVYTKQEQHSATHRTAQFKQNVWGKITVVLLSGVFLMQLIMLLALAYKF